MEKPSPADRLQQESGEKEQRDGHKEDWSPVSERHRRVAKVPQRQSEDDDSGHHRANNKDKVSSS
jgi:hypothetical protein